MSALWQEARNPADGRIYYYNTQTKETQWTKPVDLMTPAEVRKGQPRVYIQHADELYSEHCRILHGRNTQQKEEGSIGTRSTYTYLEKDYTRANPIM